jgi:pimeloyl-ACP methyl ester carboxylesterase
MVDDLGKEPELAVDIEKNSTEQEKSIPSNVSLHLYVGCGCLATLMFAGFVVFITFYMKMAKADKVAYTYSSPASILWMGLACFWLCAMELIWWLVYKNYPLYAHRLWLIFNATFAVMGFICLVSFASSKSEGDAAAAALLWIAAGIVGALTAAVWIRGTQHLPGSSLAAEQKASCCVCCMSCLSSWRAWLLGFGVIVHLFFCALTFGVTIQAAAAAHDYAIYSPPGTIYTVVVRGVTLRMHLHCRGINGSGRATAVFAHGGGDNCLGMKALADELSQSRRSCIYDGLGYGFTPSAYPRANQTAWASSGEVLAALLPAAGEAGPFVCVGHSAGAETCLRFAVAAQAGGGAVVGVVGLDGYPDLIRAGSFRPGRHDESHFVLFATLLCSVLFGPTGFSRGLVGRPEPSFVPAESAATRAALYAQSRFWVSQYWGEWP